MTCWRATFQPLLRRTLLTNHGRQLPGVDIDEVCMAARELLASHGPLTYAELGQGLRERWPERDAAAMSLVPRNLDALVQVPPAGTWNWTKPAPVTTAERWLGRPLKPASPPDKLLLRYLAAYGPASVQDMAVWSGLGGLREAVERLRPRLRVFQDESGRELFDLPDAPRPDPDTPAPVTLVAAFDNLLLSHDDRSRLIADAHRKLTMTVNGLFAATFLIDGMVSGIWKLEQDHKGGSASVVFEPFARLAKADRSALGEQATRLLAAAAPQAGRHDVRFGPVKRS